MGKDGHSFNYISTIAPNQILMQKKKKKQLELDLPPGRISFVA